VSENTANFTGPAAVGSILKATPRPVSRANSAAMSRTSNAATGIPCANIAS
jgi:hypothetical protein